MTCQTLVVKDTKLTRLDTSFILFEVHKCQEAAVDVLGAGGGGGAVR